MREFMHHFCFRCNEGKNICNMKARGFGIYRKKKRNKLFVCYDNKSKLWNKVRLYGICLFENCLQFYRNLFSKLSSKIENRTIYDNSVVRIDSPWFRSFLVFSSFQIVLERVKLGKKWLISKVLLDDIIVAEIGIFATLVVTGAIIYHSGWLFPNFTRTSRGPNFPGFDLQNHL